MLRSDLGQEAALPAVGRWHEKRQDRSRIAGTRPGTDLRIVTLVLGEEFQLPQSQLREMVRSRKSPAQVVRQSVEWFEQVSSSDDALDILECGGWRSTWDTVCPYRKL
jgi:hypothetical protein